MVEAREAYAWDCPDCGKTNYGEMVRMEMTPEERRALRINLQRTALEGEEDLEMDGDFFSFPDAVTCDKCKSEHDIQHPDEVPEDFIHEMLSLDDDLGELN